MDDAADVFSLISAVVAAAVATVTAADVAAAASNATADEVKALDVASAAVALLKLIVP